MKKRYLFACIMVFICIMILGCSSSKINTIINQQKDNKYYHPTKRVLRVLDNNNATAYRTDMLGTVTLVHDGLKYIVYWKFAKTLRDGQGIAKTSTIAILWAHSPVASKLGLCPQTVLPRATHFASQNYAIVSYVLLMPCPLLYFSWTK